MQKKKENALICTTCSNQQKFCLFVALRIAVRQIGIFIVIMKQSCCCNQRCWAWVGLVVGGLLVVIGGILMVVFDAIFESIIKKVS